MLSWVHRQELPLRAFFCLYDTFCNAAFHSLPHNVLCRFLPVYSWENLVTCSERINYEAAAWPIDKRRGISLLWPLAGPYRRIGNVKGWGFESQVSLNGSVGGLGAAASRTSGRNAETARVAHPMEADLSLLLSFIVRAGRWKAWQRLWLQAAKLAAPSTQYAAKVLEWQRLHSLWRWRQRLWISSVCFVERGIQKRRGHFLTRSTADEVKMREQERERNRKGGRGSERESGSGGGGPSMPNDWKRRRGSRTPSDEMRWK